jgi:hypothetical protein
MFSVGVSIDSPVGTTPHLIENYRCRQPRINAKMPGICIMSGY